jgi:hypothetical protein
MAKAKVLNVGKEEYVEEFKGKTITIPAGGHVVMELYEAAAFKGQYPGKGKIKQIKIEALPDNKPEPEKFVCNLCGKVFLKEVELLEHSKKHDDENKGDEEEPVKRRVGRPSNEELQKRKEKINDTSTNSGNSKGADR